MTEVFGIDGVDALFAGSIDDFVAKRDALVKELKAEKRKDDAAAVKALRKPSAAAWAINQVARSRADEVDGLFAAAGALRDAQAKAVQGKDDGSLRTTTREWRDRINALAAAAGAHRDDAMVAFETASTDEAVGPIVRAGRLVAVPEGGGLGGLLGMPDPVVQRDSIVETYEPEPAPELPPPVADDGLEERIAEAEKALEKATFKLRRAEQRLDQAKNEVRDAEAARDEAAKHLRRIIG